MEWSRYNVFFKSKRHGYVLYNTISQSLLLIPASSVPALLKLMKNPDMVETIPESSQLLKGRFVVESNNDELARHVNCVLKNRYNPSNMSLTIAVTRACNFDCVYCYEKDRKPIYMNESTEGDVLAFVKRNQHLKNLYVVWYGGEPLLNFESIERLSRSFLSLGVNYSAFVVTNGYCLDEEKIAKLDELHIVGMQVTFDGGKQTHDARRFLHGGAGSFDKIASNIDRLLSEKPDFRLDIRSNIDKRNADQYITFFSEAKARFKGPNVTLYTGFSHDLLDTGCVSSDLELAKSNDRADFYKNAFDKGGISISGFAFKTKLSTCVASNLTGFVIGPEGEVYKCWNMIGISDGIIGNVKDPAHFDQNKIARFMTGADYLFDPKCRECECLPICTGGCPMSRIREKYEGAKVDYCSVAKHYLQDYIERQIEQAQKENQNCI